jgi:hypothetical protein
MLKERESMPALGPLKAFAYPFLNVCVDGCPLQNGQHIKREHKEQKDQSQYVSPGEEKRHFSSHEEVWNYRHIEEKDHLRAF